MLLLREATPSALLLTLSIGCCSLNSGAAKSFAAAAAGSVTQPGSQSWCSNRHESPTLRCSSQQSITTVLQQSAGVTGHSQSVNTAAVQHKPALSFAHLVTNLHLVSGGAVWSIDVGDHPGDHRHLRDSHGRGAVHIYQQTCRGAICCCQRNCQCQHQHHDTQIPHFKQNPFVHPRALE